MEKRITNQIEVNYKEAELCLSFLENIEPELFKRGIAVEKANPVGAILFIGINPSFKDGDPVPGTPKYNSIYEWTSPDEKTHPYFNKSIEIADSEGIQLPFGHHDLFPIREREQGVLERMFDNDNNGRLISKKEYKQFIDASLSWSQETIRVCKPKIIVVVNAFASRLFFDYSLLGFAPRKQWNEDLGVDFIQIKETWVPIMFSGMLSGQRALDNQSEFRLRWHIRHILRHQDLWLK